MYKYHYYVVSMPSDAFRNAEEAGLHAIEEAKERARLYCTPATWTAELLIGSGSNYIFRVCRKTNKQPKYPEISPEGAAMVRQIAIDSGMYNTK